MQGSGAFEFSLDSINWQISGAFDSLSAGTYLVLIRNTETPTCFSTCSATIAEPDALACTLTGTNINCKNDRDGTVQVAVTGGLNNFDYSIDAGINWQMSNSFTGLAAGTHNVTVRDANNCLSTCMLTLTQPQPVSCSITSTDDNSCITDNGIISVSAVGGTAPYTCSIDGVNFQSHGLFANLGAGTYTVIVRDANGCENNCTATIASPTPPSCTVTAITDATCNGTADGILIATGMQGSGSFEFSLDSINWQISGAFDSLSAGTYLVLIRNTETPTCFSTCSATIAEPDALACIVTGTNINCKNDSDGTVQVAVTGGLNNFDYSICLLYTSPSPRDKRQSRMPSSA